MTSRNTSFFLYLMPSERHDTALVTVAGGLGAPVSSLCPSWVMYLAGHMYTNQHQTSKRQAPRDNESPRDLWKCYAYKCQTGHRYLYYFKRLRLLQCLHHVLIPVCVTIFGCRLVQMFLPAMHHLQVTLFQCDIFVCTKMHSQ